MHKAIRAVLEKQHRLRPFAEAAPPAPARALAPPEAPAFAEPATAGEEAGEDWSPRRDATPGPAVDPLAELERRFDGPVPVRLREAALAGGVDELARRRARADLRVYRGLIRDTIACLRALRRSDGPAAPEPAGREATLMAQLAWYRERRRPPLRRLMRPACPGAAEPSADASGHYD